MTPKEKAISLMQKYRTLGILELSHRKKDGTIVGVTSKQCALIAVDEMIERFSMFKLDFYPSAFVNESQYEITLKDIQKQIIQKRKYWEQVKHELLYL